MWCTLPAFGAASYVPAIVLERPLFVRERNDGLYRVITYLCAKMIEEMGIALLNSLIFSNVVFWPLRLQGSWVPFWLVYFTTLSTGIVLAYFIAALSPNMDVANAALPAYVVTLLFFAGKILDSVVLNQMLNGFTKLSYCMKSCSLPYGRFCVYMVLSPWLTVVISYLIAGFLLRWDDIPPWWKWYAYIDFLRYAWGSLMANQFGGSRNVGFFDDEATNTTIPVREYYNVPGSPYGWWGIETAFFAVFFVFAFLALRFVRHEKR